jgi:radical SAM superfamily enzyme YgiQ (UPF0313 family)
MNILFVQHELFTWQRAKMWGYTWHLGLEEGLQANQVEFTTLITSWLPRAKEICAGKTFDQVWINDITHTFEPGGCGGYQMQEADLEWLACLAPVRLGFLMESLEYTPEEHAKNPGLRYARSVLEKTGRYMTHIMSPDERDLPFIRGLYAVPVSLCICPVPQRFVRRNITVPPQLKPVFRGTAYGERARWLELPQVKHLINQDPSPDNFSNLPALFDNLQRQARETISRASFEITGYEQYLQTLRQIRQQSFALYLESLAEGSAVINFPSFGKIYTGRIFEGMASGRPVITVRIEDRPLSESLFEDGKDILLYPKSNPSRLAEQIKGILREPEFGQRLAMNARDKLLGFHTTEIRIRQILDWITKKQEPRYTDGEDPDSKAEAKSAAAPVLCLQSPAAKRDVPDPKPSRERDKNRHPLFPMSRSKKLRILLISPPYARFLGLGNARFPLTFGALGTMASMNGHSVGIYDADFDKDLVGKTAPYEYTFSSQNRIRQALQDPNHYVWKEIERKIGDFNPDVVGVTVMTNKLPMAARIAGITKAVYRDIRVVVGGHHPSMFGPQMLMDRNVDFAVSGEGEMTFLELVNRLGDPRPEFSRISGLVYRESERTMTNGPRELLPNLDVLPIADRDLIINEGFVSENNIMASRGCPFQCSYCGAQVLWKRKVRRRSVSQVIREIDYLFRRGPSRTVNFWDDSFTSDRRYTAELTAALKKFDGLKFSCITRLDLINPATLAQLKEAGCSFLLFGIESGSEEILQRIDKKMNRARIRQQTALVNAAGIPWLGFFIMGYPGETKKQIQETLTFMKELDPPYAEINIFNPLPGTPIWKNLEDQGLVGSDMDFSRYSQASTENHFSNGHMTQEEFRELALFMAREFDAHNRRHNGK